MIEAIKITSLTNIGANLSYNSVLPIVDINGTAFTYKANVQLIGNYILSQAGSANFVQAAQATLAQAVVNAAQPNITSVGTLTSLAVSGNVDLNSLNIDVGNLHVAGGINGYVLQTDGEGNLSWTAQTGGGSNATPGGANTQVQFNDAGDFGGNANLTFNKTTGTMTVARINSSNISATDDLILTSGSAGSNWHYTYYANGLFETPSNVNFLGSRLNLGYGSEYLSNLTSPTFVSTLSGGAFIQAALINQANTGSSDWAAYGADSDESQGWVDLGFASHSFDDPNYTITAPGSGYVFSQGYSNGIGGHLVLATGAEGDTPDIVFATGGFLAENEFAKIDHANSLFHFTRANSGIKFYDSTIQNTAWTGTVASANVTGLGNIATVNLDGNASNILLGNGTFGGVPSYPNAVVWTTTPVSNTSTGTVGQAAYDAGGNLFVCVATNTWAKFSGTLSW